MMLFERAEAVGVSTIPQLLRDAAHDIRFFSAEREGGGYDVWVVGPAKPPEVILVSFELLHRADAARLRQADAGRWCVTLPSGECVSPDPRCMHNLHPCSIDWQPPALWRTGTCIYLLAENAQGVWRIAACCRNTNTIAARLIGAAVWKPPTPGSVPDECLVEWK